MKYKLIKNILIIVCAVFLITSITPCSTNAITKVKTVKYTNKESVKYIAVGKSKKLHIEVKPKSAAKRKLKWSSSNKKIATVSSNGKITAKRLGSVKITCRVSSQPKKKVQCKVMVIKPSRQIDFYNETETLQLGQTLQHLATVYPSDASVKSIIYTSSNTKVATVDKHGKITPISIGTATIYAKAKDGYSKSKSYKVNVIENIRSSAKYIAHRGLSSEAPENTAKAFELAGISGFWGVETDVHETKDGKFVLMHDASLERMCGTNKLISELTLSQIRDIFIITGSNYESYKDDPTAYTIPTLEEYLKICIKYDMVPIIEIKMSLDFSEIDDTLTSSNDIKLLESIPSTEVDDDNIPLSSVGDKELLDLYKTTKNIMGDNEFIFIDFDLQTLVRLRMLLNDMNENNVQLQHLVNTIDESIFKTYDIYNIAVSANFYNLDSNQLGTYVTSGRLQNAWTIDNLDSIVFLTRNRIPSITTNSKFW